MKNMKHSRPNKLSEILKDIPKPQREELARTWEAARIANRLEAGEAGKDAAYRRVEARIAAPERRIRRVAAAVALIVVGAAAGFALALLSASSGTVDDRPQFMILVRHRDDSGRSPTEYSEIVEELGAWSQRLAEEGYLEDANELAQTGNEIRLVNGDAQVSNLELTPASPSGYFLIRARSYEEATRLAGTCPFLQRGGTLEVRRIVN